MSSKSNRDKVKKNFAQCIAFAEQPTHRLLRRVQIAYHVGAYCFHAVNPNNVKGLKKTTPGPRSPLPYPLFKAWLRCSIRTLGNSGTTLLSDRKAPQKYRRQGYEGTVGVEKARITAHNR
uniref:Transposase n=1 Tax=Panagrellus redivivus TaxID=6233 RepID=A0A7E4V9V7_PANRE